MVISLLGVHDDLLVELRPDPQAAVGTAGPGGTLTADTVEQDALPAGALRKALPTLGALPKGLPRPSLGAGLPTFLPSSGTGSLFARFGCAPAAITSADLLALSD